MSSKSALIKKSWLSICSKSRVVSIISWNLLKSIINSYTWATHGKYWTEAITALKPTLRPVLTPGECNRLASPNGKKPAWSGVINMLTCHNFVNIHHHLWIILDTEKKPKHSLYLDGQYNYSNGSSFFRKYPFISHCNSYKIRLNKKMLALQRCHSANTRNT